ncbi:MAG: hypothetical protein AAFZ52_18280, partial [Bacteroidota bacterium]
SKVPHYYRALQIRNAGTQSNTKDAQSNTAFLRVTKKLRVPKCKQQSRKQPKKLSLPENQEGQQQTLESNY